MIGITRPIGLRHRRVTLANPGAAVPDGDGGYTQTLAPLDPPALYAYVRPATARDLEQVVGGTTLPTATHAVTVPYHPGITTETVVTVEHHPHAARVLKVVYVGNPDERDASQELICAEQVS